MLLGFVATLWVSAFVVNGLTFNMCDIKIRTENFDKLIKWEHQRTFAKSYTK